jgi:hypothetical protein
VNGSFREKRKHGRIAHHFVVHFKPSDAPETGWQLTTTRNISEGGCLISSGHPYPEEQMLDFRIQLPSIQKPVAVSGRVCRCTKGGETDVWFVAVMFTKIEDREVMDFYRIMNFFLKKKDDTPEQNPVG